mmetsp:Transcript_11797/g.29901  ORF Transcript_11797/g.29901 Transcript_11797/m.29901 type:complete len:215 (+) Transcript_11797:1680-2324(+)
MNSCQWIVVSSLFTRMALKISTTSSSVRAPSDPASAFDTSTSFRLSRLISPVPSVSMISNSFRKSLIWSGNNVKLKTSDNNFRISENSLNPMSALTTLGLRTLSCPVSSRSRLACTFSHACFCASRAVGRFLGSVTNKSLTKAFPKRLTRSHISAGSNSKSPSKIFCRTTIKGSGPPHPPKGGSPLNNRKAITPIAQISHRSSYWPRMTSGATV